MTNDDGLLDERLRRHFITRWTPGCTTAFGSVIPMLPENSDAGPVAAQRSAEFHIFGTRDICGGGADSRMERTLGRVQLTFWLPRGWATEDRDAVQRIWRPMWAPAEVNLNPELEGVHFGSVQRLAEVGKTETHTQYVSDVSFRWDE
jgi:hypothetical protein